MVIRGVSAVVGVVFVLVGGVFVGQGTNVIHGSSMSGHGGYAVLGGVLVVVGLVVLRSVRPRPDRTP
jgi:hypothetical protein